MFNYRLNVKLDYYYKYTSSLIYDIPIPGSLYTFGAQVENAMEISNEGLELELQADILRESAVSWRMKFNMNFPMPEHSVSCSPRPMVSTCGNQTTSSNDHPLTVC